MRRHQRLNSDIVELLNESATDVIISTIFSIPV